MQHGPVQPVVRERGRRQADNERLPDDVRLNAASAAMDGVPVTLLTILSNISRCNSLFLTMKFKHEYLITICNAVTLEAAV